MDDSAEVVRLRGEISSDGEALKSQRQALEQECSLVEVLQLLGPREQLLAAKVKLLDTLQEQVVERLRMQRQAQEAAAAAAAAATTSGQAGKSAEGLENPDDTAAKPKADDQPGESAAAGGQEPSRWHKFCRVATSCVNVRFLAFKRHFLLALVVLFLSLGGVFALARVLKGQCVQLCSSGVLGELQPTDEYTCSLYATKVQLSTVVADLFSLTSYGLAGVLPTWYKSETQRYLGQLNFFTFGNRDVDAPAYSSSINVHMHVTKCSFQHKENCGTVEWANLIQGLAALRHSLDPLTERSVPFPPASNQGTLASGDAQASFSGQAERIKRLLSSTSSLSNSSCQPGNILGCCLTSAGEPTGAAGCSSFRVQAYQRIAKVTGAMLQGLPMWQAFPQHANFPTYQGDTVLFKAPAGAACCDVVFNTQPFHVLNGTRDVVSIGVLKIRSSNLDSISSGSDAACSSSGRCSYVEVTARALPWYPAATKGPFDFDSAGFDFCNLRGESASNATVTRNVQLSACQYIAGQGATSSFCLNATVPIKVLLLADTAFCRIPSCLKDPRLGVAALSTDPPTFVPHPLGANVMDLAANSTNFLLANGVPVCTLCPELCINGRPADVASLYPGASSTTLQGLQATVTSTRPSMYLQGYPEWLLGGRLIEWPYNLSGQLPASPAAWASLSGVNWASSNYPLIASSTQLLTNDGMYAWMLALAADNASSLGSQYVAGPVSYSWLLLQHLLPVAHDYGVSLAAMAGSMDPDNTSSSSSSTDDLSGLWNEKQLFCCTSDCPTWLAAVGTALGYYTHLEMLVAFACVLLYVNVARQEGAGGGFMARLKQTWVAAMPEEDKQGQGAQPAQPAPLTQSRSKVQPV